MRELEFLGFDVFGTVVDWRTSVARDLEPFLARHGLGELEPHQIADRWRGFYRPSMAAVRSGARDWVPLSVLNRESLETLLGELGLDVAAVPAAELDELNRAWERLDPWPDAVEGLTRLRRKYVIAPISNGHIAGMTRLARYAKLPWDAILGAEIAHTYKPEPEVYLAAVNAMELEPEQCALVAAHPSDLAAARACGLATAFIPRPLEHGPGAPPEPDLGVEWDLRAPSIVALAEQLGC